MILNVTAILDRFRLDLVNKLIDSWNIKTLSLLILYYKLANYNVKSYGLRFIW